MIVENCSYSRDGRLRNEAKALQNAGYEVSVISPQAGGWPSRATVEGVVVYSFPIFEFLTGTIGYFLEYGWATFAITCMVSCLCVGRGFDVLHVANPPDCIVPVLAIFKLFGKQIIYDQHDLSPELYQVKFSRHSALLLYVQLLLERLSYRLADHTIVTNESYREIAIQRGRCSPAKVTVVRNGPDVDQCRGQEINKALRQKSANIIVFAGVTGFQDGLGNLCRALHELRFRFGRDDFLCIVLGDGDALEDTKELSLQLGVSENLWFTGWVSDRDKYWQWLCTADICVAPEPANPYNLRSTFIKVTEYMLAGKPIVAFDLPESRFTAGPAAIYVTPNDEREFAASLLRLIENPDLRQSMGQRGRERVHKSLAWQYSVPDLLRCYSQMRNLTSKEEWHERAIE